MGPTAEITMSLRFGHPLHSFSERCASNPSRPRLKMQGERRSMRYGSHSPVDPVGNVERTVQSQRSEVVRRDRLGLARSLEHEKLRQDRDALEPDGERPNELKRRVSVVEQQCQNCHGGNEVRQPEGIQRCVLRRPDVSYSASRTGEQLA